MTETETKTEQTDALKHPAYTELKAPAKQLLFDLLVTFAEGGFSYCPPGDDARGFEYHWAKEEGGLVPDIEGAYYIISYEKSDGKYGRRKLTPESMWKGLCVLLEREDVGLHPSYVGELLVAYRAAVLGTEKVIEDLDLDAERANWVAQLALYGEVVYG